MEHWSAEVDEVLRGDAVVMLVYATPANGAVLLPVNNYGGGDRFAGTLPALNSSVGGWRKLERIRANPKIAIAFHTRAHGRGKRPNYVLVQGRATLSEPIPDYPQAIGERWEQVEPWAGTSAVWRRWMRAYALRVELDLTVERVIAWPDLGCRGGPTVFGADLPDPPESQSPPGKGTGPRLDARRAAARSARLPNTLLGWVGADGYPIAVPVGVTDGDRDGIELNSAAGLLPTGARRAGLTAHSFSAGAVGQNQRKYTGWLQVAEGGAALYAPHTQSNYRFPPSRTLYRLLLGGVTRWGLRGARRAGVLEA